jgi:hypothetical protein
MEKISPYCYKQADFNIIKQQQIYANYSLAKPVMGQQEYNMLRVLTWLHPVFHSLRNWKSNKIM